MVLGRLDFLKLAKNIRQQGFVRSLIKIYRFVRYIVRKHEKQNTTRSRRFIPNKRDNETSVLTVVYEHANKFTVYGEQFFESHTEIVRAETIKSNSFWQTQLVFPFVPEISIDV